MKAENARYLTCLSSLSPFVVRRSSQGGMLWASGSQARRRGRWSTPITDGVGIVIEALRSPPSIAKEKLIGRKSGLTWGSRPQTGLVVPKANMSPFHTLGYAAGRRVFCTLRAQRVVEQVHDSGAENQGVDWIRLTCPPSLLLMALHVIALS
jgi:hypothetical protein